MKKPVVFLLILIVSIQMTYAHNPLSALYYLEVKETISLLNINLSQSGLNEALKKHHPTTNLDTISNIRYKQLAVEYIKGNFDLYVNDQKIQLLEGGLKLGNHQTDLKFVISELPEAFQNLSISIPAFAENEHHQTVFSVLLNGNSSKVILNQKNKYKASVTFENNEMVVESKSFNKNYLWCLAIIPIILIGKKFIARLT